MNLWLIIVNKFKTKIRKMEGLNVFSICCLSMHIYARADLQFATDYELPLNYGVNLNFNFDDIFRDNI